MDGSWKKRETFGGERKDNKINWKQGTGKTRLVLLSTFQIQCAIYRARQESIHGASRSLHYLWDDVKLDFRWCWKIATRMCAQCAGDWWILCYGTPTRPRNRSRSSFSSLAQSWRLKWLYTNIFGRNYKLAFYFNMMHCQQVYDRLSAMLNYHFV